MNNSFSERAWTEYLYWQQKDKAIARKINELIKDIKRNGLDRGIGKPEKLRYNFMWSRRITQEHRLVYTIESESLIIFSCKGHYDD